MLNYTKAPIVKEVVKKVDDDNIEIKKLLKYSKLGEKIITLHLHDDEEKVTDYPPLGGIIDTKNYKDVISLVKTFAVDKTLSLVEQADVDEFEKIT